MKPISQYGKTNEYASLLLSLDDKLNGRITQEELSYICFLWSYHFALKAYAYKPLPVTPPFMLEFYRLKEESRRKLLANDTSKKTKRVKEYLGGILNISNENKVNKEWLEEMLEHLTEPGQVQKIKEVLNGHR